MDRAEIKAVLGDKSGKEGKKKQRRLVFTVLSEIVEHTLWKSSLSYICLLFVELCHIFYLPLTSLPNKDPSLTVFTYIVTIFNYPRFFLETFTDNGWMIMLAVGCVEVLFCLGLLMSIIILGYLTARTTIRHPSAVKLLGCMASVGLMLLLTIQLLPLLETFIFPLLCANGSHFYAKAGSVSAADSIQCGSYSQIILTCFGGVLVLMTIALYLATAYLFIEDCTLSPLPWAGESRELFFLHALSRICLDAYVAIDVRGMYSGYALILGWLLQAVMVYTSASGLRIIYKPEIHIAHCMQLGIGFSVYSYAALHLLYETESSLFICITAITAGVCIGYLLYTRNCSTFEQTLFKDSRQLKLLRHAEEYTHALCYLCKAKRDTTLWKVVLRHILLVHIKDCTDEACLCHKHRPAEASRGGQAAIGQSSPQSEMPLGISGAGEDRRTGERKNDWLALIELLLELEAGKWKNSRNIMMEISYFQAIVKKNDFKAYYWVMKSEAIRCSYPERLGPYRMKRILAHTIVMKESRGEGAGELRLAMQFLRLSSDWRRVLERTASTFMTFWKFFESARLNVRELFGVAQKITTLATLATDLFHTCIKLSPNYVNLYRYYGCFVWLVLNHQKEGVELLERGEEIWRKKTEGRSKYSTSIMSASDSALVVVSGNLESIGTILQANQHVKEQLGYSVADLQGRNVSRIMPRIIGGRHDDLMVQHLQTGQAVVLGQERLSIIQSKDGMCEPIWMLIRTLPSLDSGIRYVGYLRRDLEKVCTTYIKMSTQQKTKGVSFVIADANNFIVGISARACELFGLSYKYIMRKKGLTSIPFPVGKLAPELGNPNFEPQLAGGMNLLLATSCILEYLDYDFITKQEEATVRESTKTPKQAYVVMIALRHQDAVLIKIYAIVDLSIWGQSSGNNRPLRGLATPDPEAERKATKDEGKLENSGQSQMWPEDTDKLEGREPADVLPIPPETQPPNPPAESSEEQPKVNSVRIRTDEIKAQVSPETLKTEPESLTSLKLAIVTFILLLLGCAIAGCVLHDGYLGHAETLELLVDTAYRRGADFNIILGMMLSYMNIANGQEQELSPVLGSRMILIQNETNNYINRLKNHEALLEDLIARTSLSDEMEQVVYPTLATRKMQKDFTVYTEPQRLTTVLYALAAKLSTVILMSKSQLQSEAYRNSFSQRMGSYELSVVERDVYYFVVNAVAEVHRVLSRAGTLLYDRAIKVLEEQHMRLLFLHCATYAVIIVFALIFIPIIAQIQRNKRRLLIYFAELRPKEVRELSGNCLRFLKQHSASVTASIDGTQDPEEEDKSEVQEMPRPPAATSEELFVQVFLNKELGVATVKRAVNPKEKKPEDEDEDVDAKTTFIENEKEKHETEMIEERKSRIANVSVGFGYVSLVLLAIFLVILGYYSKILYSLFSNSRTIKNNIDQTLIVDKRLFYLSSTLVFYCSYLNSFQRFHYIIDDVDPYEFYFDRSLKAEELARYYKTYPSSEMESLAQIARSYDSPDFCQAVSSSFRRLNVSMCQSMMDGLLKEGLAASISYVLTTVRNKYLSLSTLSNSQRQKLVELRGSDYINMRLILLEIYEPTFYDLEVRARNIYKDYIEWSKRLLIVDYVIMGALILLSLVILLCYFIKKIRDETNTGQGILALLPQGVLHSQAAS